jgi:hypothetical protein
MRGVNNAKESGDFIWAVQLVPPCVGGQIGKVKVMTTRQRSALVRNSATRFAATAESNALWRRNAPKPETNSIALTG